MIFFFKDLIIQFKRCFISFSVKLLNEKFSRKKCELQTYRQVNLLTTKMIHRGALLLKIRFPSVHTLVYQSLSYNAP